MYKIRPIYEDLSKESEFEKCLHGKTQNANEPFNGMIWNRIPKDDFASLPRLQFDVYDAVSNFDIGMKASVLTYGKLGFASGIYTTKGCKEFNAKRVSLAVSRLTPKRKLRRQLLRAKKLSKNEKMDLKGGELYAPGTF